VTATQVRTRTFCGTVCTINVSFTPRARGAKEGTLSTGTGGPTAALAGNGSPPPTPPTPPTPGPAPPALALGLDAKEAGAEEEAQVLRHHERRRHAGSGRQRQEDDEAACGRRKTKVKAKLKGSKREKHEDKLATSGKAKAKVEPLATDQFGNTDIEESKVRLKDEGPAVARAPTSRGAVTALSGGAPISAWTKPR
jgi:hypothetical protein